jgi:hypothetical protein
MLPKHLPRRVDFIQFLLGFEQIIASLSTDISLNYDEGLSGENK